MIASLHLARVGRRSALGLLRAKPDGSELRGLRYAVMTLAVPLGKRLPPRPELDRVALIAAWEDDDALERFLETHPLAARLADGWHVRLAPTRISGAWPALAGLLEEEQPMDDDEPAAALTLGRLRLSQTVRFLRASAAAEELAVGEPALLASTGLARAPSLVATFSLWQSTRAMRAYATGQMHPGHVAAVRAHATRAFHHESAFIRFRPYGASGSWDGREPLASAVLQPSGPERR